REGGLIDMGVEHGFVRKAGAWYTYEGDQLGQGKENARNFLKDNPDLANEIEKKILEKLGVGVRPEKPTEEPGADAAVTVGSDDAAKTVPAPAAKTAKAKATAVKS
ncbi:MAG: DNA recombination/repair protein RecA, partial [Streptomyces turgidiscabies]|nr:DNA recombination/repair protein RecA [Streptomyces turgidiscabies]